jgi:hypothetical protein
LYLADVSFKFLTLHAFGCVKVLNYENRSSWFPCSKVLGVVFAKTQLAAAESVQTSGIFEPLSIGIIEDREVVVYTTADNSRFCLCLYIEDLDLETSAG